MGGSNNSAQKAAQAEQEQRQAAIDQAQGRINAVFNSPQRQADINDFVDATRQYYDQNLDQQKAQADRSLKFALAKSGLIGGSEQVGQQQQLSQNYQQGQLQAEQKALGAGASLSAADQESRARLIALATQGLDSTNAATQAAEALRSNLVAGRSAANADAMGDVFAQFNKFSSDVDAAKQRRLANEALSGLYARQPGATNGYGGP
jgi:hypothetical protein